MLKEYLRMNESDVLSSLIEKSVSNDSPIVITNADGRDIGIISDRKSVV